MRCAGFHSEVNVLLSEKRYCGGSAFITCRQKRTLHHLIQAPPANKGAMLLGSKVSPSQAASAGVIVVAMVQGGENRGSSECLMGTIIKGGNQ